MVEFFRKLCSRSLTRAGSRLISIFSFLKEHKFEVEAEWLLAHGEQIFHHDAVALQCLADQHEQRGDDDSYERVALKVIALSPARGQIVKLSSHMLKVGKVEQAIELLMNASEASNDEALRRKLFALLLRERRFHELAVLLNSRLASDPNDALALGYRAHLLFLQQRFAESLESTRRAIALGCDLPNIAGLLERLTQRTSRLRQLG